jgi:hypothetical protein
MRSFFTLKSIVDNSVQIFPLVNICVLIRHFRSFRSMLQNGAPPNCASVRHICVRTNKTMMTTRRSFSLLKFNLLFVLLGCICWRFASSRSNSIVQMNNERHHGAALSH